jgi:hypothetical protein
VYVYPPTLRYPASFKSLRWVLLLICGQAASAQISCDAVSNQSRNTEAGRPLAKANKSSLSNYCANRKHRQADWSGRVPTLGFALTQPCIVGSVSCPAWEGGSRTG